MSALEFSKTRAMLLPEEQHQKREDQVIIWHQLDSFGHDKQCEYKMKTEGINERMGLTNK